MQKAVLTFSVTLFFLLLLDFAVAGFLGWAKREDRLASLVRYFEYGRSVPGKLNLWEECSNCPENLYDVGWLEAGVAQSKIRFAKEFSGTKPVVRSYGMSFVNNILTQAQTLDTSLLVDGHGGPGAPPNFTYAFFLDDRANRRSGDIVVLGILSSSVPAMAALSNQTWVFEQPAPFTYPIFRPEGNAALKRLDPLVTTAKQHRALDTEPELAETWAKQLAKEDEFYSPVTHGFTWLDQSPLARLVRRSMAAGHVDRVNQQVIQGGFPYEEVLRHMVESFARVARQDGQFPVVMLIQSRDPGDPDLQRVVRPVLERERIPYLATAEYFDPRDPGGFLPDGHYRPEVDRRFGEAFIAIID